LPQVPWLRIKKRNVRQDWRTELRAAKLDAFEFALEEVEPASVIFSMALNEAIALWKSNQYDLARDQVNFSADLCDRFATSLDGVLQALNRHAHYRGSLPAVLALNPDLFIGKIARRLAAMNSLLSVVLFTQNNRFLHKLWTLREMVSDNETEYRNIATHAAEGSGSSQRQDWSTLSNLESDLNTTWLETKVVLKSFIVSMPEAEVGSFRSRLVVSLAAASALAEKRAAVYRRV